MFHAVQGVPVILTTLLGQQGTLATLQSSRALISQWSVWQTLSIQVSSTAGPIPVGQELVEVSTSVCCTVETLYNGHHWDPAGCPVYSGVPNSKVELYTALCGWDSRHCIHWKVSLIQSVLYREVPPGFHCIICVHGLVL